MSENLVLGWPVTKRLHEVTKKLRTTEQKHVFIHHFEVRSKSSCQYIYIENLDFEVQIIWW